jgi:hypothetical protein
MYEYFRSKRINKYIYIHTLYMYTDYTCLHRNNCFHHKVFCETSLRAALIRDSHQFLVVPPKVVNHRLDRQV